MLTAILAVAALFGSGCATTTTTGFDPVGSLSNQPSTLLEGASIDEARSVAMASARSKGWTLVSTTEDTLILERVVSPASPQASALGAMPGGPASRVQVRTSIVPRPNGTQVSLQAFVLVNPGTEAEKRIDYTDDYQDDLAVSLSSLQSAWLATGHRLASPAPVPQAPAPEAPDDITQPAAPVTAEQEAGAEDTARDGFAAGSGFSGTAWGDGDATSEADSTPSPAPTSGIVPLSSFNDANQRSASNPMLALDANTRTGVWAYYAERFAQQQGCVVSDIGALLLQKTPTFELHEVGCRNGANRLVKCQDGTCQSVIQSSPY